MILTSFVTYSLSGCDRARVLFCVFHQDWVDERYLTADHDQDQKHVGAEADAFLARTKKADKLTEFKIVLLLLATRRLTIVEILPILPVIFLGRRQPDLSNNG